MAAAAIAEGKNQKLVRETIHKLKSCVGERTDRMRSHR